MCFRKLVGTYFNIGIVIVALVTVGITSCLETRDLNMFLDNS